MLEFWRILTATLFVLLGVAAVVTAAVSFWFSLLDGSSIIGLVLVAFLSAIWAVIVVDGRVEK